MTTPNRQQILKANEAIRRGNGLPPRRLDDGEVAFRIPEDDWKVLIVLYPDLVNPDFATRHAAWLKFKESPVAEKYFVTRTPRQVRRSHKNRIHVR